MVCNILSMGYYLQNIEKNYIEEKNRLAEDIETTGFISYFIFSLYHISDATYQESKGVKWFVLSIPFIFPIHLYLFSFLFFSFFSFFFSFCVFLCNWANLHLFCLLSNLDAVTIGLLIFLSFIIILLIYYQFSISISWLVGIYIYKKIKLPIF